MLKATVRLLKDTLQLLPEGRQKADVGEALESAERQLKLGQAVTLQGLGYELCRAHNPPEAMLSDDNRHWKCPVCGNQRVHAPPPIVLRDRKR